MFAEARIIIVVFICHRVVRRGSGLVRRLRRRVGEGIKMPLVGDAATVGEHGVAWVVRLGQGRVGADTLVEHRHAVGQGSNGRQLDLLRLVGLDYEGVPHLRVGAGHHERKILHHINVIGTCVGIVKRRQRIDIHTTCIDGDAVFLRARLLDEDVLDVVDHVVGQAHRAVNGRADVVAVIDLVGVGRCIHRLVVGVDGIRRGALVNQRIRDRRHDQVEVIDELDGGIRVAGRVGPRQREAQWIVHCVGAKSDLPRAALTGGQGVGQSLVDESRWPSVLVGFVFISQSRHGSAKVRQPPALVVHRAADVVVVPGVDRLRAVDQQGLHQRRAVGPLVAAGEAAVVKLFHQGQHAADRRGGHAGAGFVPVLVAEFVILFFQRVGVRLRVGGGDRVFPVGGTGGNNERAGRDQIRLEPTERPLDADAHIAAARERRHLVVRIRHAGERRVGGCGHFLLLDLVAVLVGLSDSVGDAGVRLGADLAERLDRADGDHILGRAWRSDGVRAGVEAVVCA